MPSPVEIAEAHQRRRIARTDRAVVRGLSAWRGVDLANLDGSWSSVGPAVTSLVAAAQVADAADSNSYVAAAAREYGASRSSNLVNPVAFSGVDGSGRDVESLLHGAVTTTKTAIGSGRPGFEALQAGAAYLASMMKTAISDLGRSSDMTAATGKGWTEYVRVVQPGACSRCAILAGKSDYKTAFKRHPACKCTSYPVENEADQPPQGFHATPDDYFASLSPAEQDRVFTKAGAEAVRLGADPIQVVSGRRGSTGISYGGGIRRQTRANSGRQMMQTRIGRNTDGSPVYGYVTNEGATRRGDFGRLNRNLGTAEQRLTGARYTSTNYQRLMPETIVGLTDDVALRQTLLRDAGYMRSNLATSDPRRLAAVTADRQAATEFYRSLGIQLG
jgi:hypothetical protein